MNLRSMPSRLWRKKIVGKSGKDDSEAHKNQVPDALAEGGKEAFIRNRPDSGSKKNSDDPMKGQAVMMVKQIIDCF